MAKDGGSKKEKKSSNTTKIYLIAYNAIQTIGWSYLLYQLANYYLTSSKDSLYETVKWTVIIFQNSAVLEVIHAATGMVPSNPVITAFQVASRVILVCGAMIPTQSAKETIGLPMALTAWSFAEIIRYGNYTLNMVNMLPYVVVWLRYTAFYILYPVGVTGELFCLYFAQKEVAETQIFTVDMPNSWNFIFHYRYCLLFIMFLYIPLFPQMYLHMIKQRRKVIGGESPKKVK